MVASQWKDRTRNVIVTIQQLHDQVQDSGN